MHQRSDGDDAADGIGDAHERGMQGGCDIPDDHVADETGEDKDGEMSQEDRGCIGSDE